SPVVYYPLDLPSFPTRRSSDLGRCFNLRNLTSNFRAPQRWARAKCASVGRWRARKRPPLSPLPPPKKTKAPVSTRVSNKIAPERSEEHTSELQSRENLVCRLLL